MKKIIITVCMLFVSIFTLAGAAFATGGTIDSLDVNNQGSDGIININGTVTNLEEIKIKIEESDTNTTIMELNTPVNPETNTFTSSIGLSNKVKYKIVVTANDTDSSKNAEIRVNSGVAGDDGNLTPEEEAAIAESDSRSGGLLFFGNNTKVYLIIAIVAGIDLIAIIWIVFIYRRRQAQKNRQEKITQKS